MKTMLNLLRKTPSWALFALVCVALGMLFPHAAHPVAAPMAMGLGGAVMGAIFDAQTLISDKQALTATALSSFSYDNVLATNNISTGEPMAILFTVVVAADHTTGDETYQFAVVQSANADLSASDTIVETVVAYLTAAKLVAGYQFALPIPPNLVTKRYLGANYTLAGTTPSVTVSAAIVPLKMVPATAVYPKNFTISS